MGRKTSSIKTPPECSIEGGGNMERFRAIKARREYLEHVLIENPAFKGCDFTSLSRAVFVLATRFAKHPEWLGHEVDEQTQLLWEVEWYFDYLQGIEELLPFLKSEVSCDALILRGRTQIPISSDSDLIREWIGIDASSDIKSKAKAFWSSDPLDTLSSAWPDAGLLPGSAYLKVTDLAAWTEKNGIAGADEVKQLFDLQKISGLADSSENLGAGGTAGDSTGNEQADGLPIKNIVSIFKLTPENTWGDKLRRPLRDGLKYKDAHVSPGSKGKGNANRYNPAKFAVIYIKENPAKSHQIQVLFAKIEELAKWRDEFDGLISAENGGL